MMKLSFLKSKYFVILIAITIKVILQLIATSNSGFHGDEFLHIEAGKHPDFGYMDFPPLIGLLSWVQNLFQSDSIYIHHLFNYINSALIMLICGLITIRLGGTTPALMITEAAVIFSPGFAASQYLFLPTAFEQLFWLLIVYFMTQLSFTNNKRWFFYIALTAAAGFLNKYSIAFLLAGIVVSLLFHYRSALVNRHLWLALLLFIIVVFPNVLWQYANDFPIFHHMSALYKTQLEKQSVTNEILTVILFLNPISFVLWASALLIVPFSAKFQSVKFPVISLVFSFILLMLSKGKSYYFFPIVLSLIPFGAVYIESLVQSRKLISHAYLFLLISIGVYLLPHGIPLMETEKYIKLYKIKHNNDNKIPLTFENYYSAKNWNRLLTSADYAFKNLPDHERKHCLIWGRHYSIAGGINLLGRKNNLAEAFSFHSSFFEWVPDFSKEITVIAISESNLGKSYWEQYFGNVELVDTIDNHFATEKNWYSYHVFVCRQIKYNSAELKQIFKNQVF